MSRINYNDKKVHNKNPLYRFLLRTVDFQIITSIGFCLLYLVFYLCKTIHWIVFSNFCLPSHWTIPLFFYIMEFRLSFWWSVLLLFIFFFSFDVIIITRNKRNVNIKSDKKFIKLKYTENSENIVKYADMQNSD